jgi:2,3-bisphosphoglycerate-dependent phosphoglycerate mutase
VYKHFIIKKMNLITRLIKVTLICLLLSNFSAFAQKTNVWVVRDAENSETAPGTALSAAGQQRAADLLKALKHEKVQTIYVSGEHAAALTADELAKRNKILPRVYTDDAKTLVAKILKNFKGTNVLIIAQANAVIPIIQELGAQPPFEKLNNDDYDLLFLVSISDNDKTDLNISHYGKPHHSTEIPQQFILQSYYPNYVPPVSNH